MPDTLLLTPLVPATEPELSVTRPFGPWANGLQMTPEEFERATQWDEFYRYELVNGVLVVSPPADIGERSAVIGENTVHQTDLLPGFELPVGRLLAVADRLTTPPETTESEDA